MNDSMFEGVGQDLTLIMDAKMCLFKFYNHPWEGREGADGQEHPDLWATTVG